MVKIKRKPAKCPDCGLRGRDLVFFQAGSVFCPDCGWRASMENLPRNRKVNRAKQGRGGAWRTIKAYHEKEIADLKKQLDKEIQHNANLMKLLDEKGD